MDEEQLRTFVATSQHGTITGAAAVVYRSQPAVSRRIAQLESQLGASLFDRTTDGMRLSAAGRALLPFAQAALAAIEDGRHAVRSLNEEDLGPVTVAIVGTLAGGWLTGMLREFAATRPAVDLRLRTANSSEVLELVRGGEATFGIGYLPATDPSLTSTVLFHERLVIACPPDHPKAGTRIRSLHTLRHERWLAFPAPPTRAETSSRHIHALLGAAGVPEEDIQLVDSLTAQKRLIEAGFGIALVPESSMVDEAAAGTLATIQIVNNQQSTVNSSPLTVNSAPSTANSAPSTIDGELSTAVVLTERRRAYLSHAAASLRGQLTRGPG
jgi:DNA-binding transcriptional LysR family regulator